MANKKLSNVLRIVLILAIILILYNVILFAICGFADHGASYWISYSFTMAAFATVLVCCIILSKRGFDSKSYLLNYPILKHSVTYLIVQAVASVVFVILDYIDCPWAIALAVQAIIFALHLIMLISTFTAKTVAEEVTAKVQVKTNFTKLLQIDAEMIAETATDSDVKNAYSKLSEEIRFSDPMSCEAISDIEEQLVSKMALAKGASDKEELISICESISVLLIERNKKCKALK